jgi:ParB-like chromosome segregation protein Spo0J
VRAVERSIERHGLLHPLVVNAVGGRLQLLDGFKRLEGLERQGTTQAPVRRLMLDEQQARAALLSLNAPHRGVSELEEAWVVRALVREHGLMQTQVADLWGRHKSWVCRRLQLCERLEAGVTEDMRLGLLSATVAWELARLPHGNQPQVAEAVRRHQLSSRQTGELVARFLGTGEADIRHALVAQRT